MSAIPLYDEMRRYMVFFRWWDQCLRWMELKLGTAAQPGPDLLYGTFGKARRTSSFWGPTLRFEDPFKDRFFSPPKT